jgi:polynucleotide 5'-hydroxyl-kinase GRC3/NOL9
MPESGPAWDVPPNWSPALEAAREGGTLFLIGGVDSGKSVLAAILANAAFEAGRAIAVVDADTGQSDIGPPTCVGMARVTQSIHDLEELSADAIDFVGSSSPVGHLLGAAASAHAMTLAARSRGAETIIVDTTGLISGGVARALKSAKIRLLDPDVLVALQAEDECEHLLTPYARRERPRVIRLRQSRRVKPRTREQRTARRQAKLRSYFAAGRLIEVSWGQAPIDNSAWTTGEPAPGHVRAFAEERVECEVLYAESRADGLLLIVSGRPNGAGLRSLNQDYGGPARAIDINALDHLLVGLLGARGETLALGILESIDFRARRSSIFTPVGEAAVIKGLRLGTVRAARDGTELGWIEPGDIA